MTKEIRLLVVEDNQDKLRRVLEVANSSGIDQEHVHYAHDAIEAKRKLIDIKFDLMILDIALPSRADELPTPNGGINLLREILERDLYQRPREIIGLTAFPDVRESAGPIFADDLWSVILYDPTSNDWRLQIERKIKHVQLAQSSSSIPQREAFLCVLSALPEPEFAALLKIPWKWQQVDLPNDSTIYYRGSIKKNGFSQTVIAACAPRMGMTASAVLAAKMIGAFRPNYIAMIGIAAGVKGRCALGDIISADPSWDWGSGKQFMLNGFSAFAAAPHQIGLNSFIRGKLALMSQDAAALDEIRREWSGPKVKTVLKMHVGPLASGAAVLANTKVVKSICEQHRKLLAIDMETYAFFEAATEAPLPEVKAFSLKSVCDYADSSKNDSYQEYAAYTSAGALRIFVERFL